MALRRRKPRRALRRLAALGGFVAAVAAYRKQMLATNERRFGEALPTPAQRAADPSSNGQVSAAVVTPGG